MKKNRLILLFNKAFDDTLSEAERKELFLYLNDVNRKEEVFQLFDKARDTFKNDKHLFTALETQVLKQRLLDSIPIEKAVKERSLTKWFIAASVMLLLMGGVYFHRNNHSSIVEDNVLLTRDVIKPGTSRASLSIGDGKTIFLDSIDGYLEIGDGVTIHKTAEGQLIYHTDANGTISIGEQVKENVLSTPRGGQYQMILPDGTKVWLSAASSLSYPTQFTGLTRSISLIGEAYFEVTKQEDKPFVVKLSNASIQVLGTSFLVNAYEDLQEMKTTLVEGKVHLSANGSTSSDGIFLSPGQQAILHKKTRHIEIHNVDTDDILAWKKGHFVFQNDHIEEVMRAIALWYDVDVVYQGDMTGETFIGTISRFERIEELLKTIELTGGVHFKIEGRKILVTK
ncbi:FecR family protein [Olivibacter sp. SDN3]|uniref:FecR family protein n=1 Tax=Olivibacter sp. SDN3 TaxID=2764720 RepID=UPI001650E388|nr:FecR family protein [Olivibacter sp. SDN3]QNL49333.1 FecR family protein [Olivibacter sp. SDN3]